MRRYAKDGTRLTDCCGAYSTYVEGYLCCKACYEVVPIGQGDGNERKEVPDERHAEENSRSR